MAGASIRGAARRGAQVPGARSLGITTELVENIPRRRLKSLRAIRSGRNSNDTCRGGRAFSRTVGGSLSFHSSSTHTTFHPALFLELHITDPSHSLCSARTDPFPSSAATLARLSGSFDPPGLQPTYTYTHYFGATSSSRSRSRSRSLRSPPPPARDGLPRPDQPAKPARRRRGRHQHLPVPPVDRRRGRRRRHVRHRHVRPAVVRAPPRHALDPRPARAGMCECLRQRGRTCAAWPSELST